MVDNKFISARQLMSEIKMSSMMQSLTMEQLVSFIVSYARRWGVSVLFEQKTKALEVSDYDAFLPCDVYDVIAVRDCDTHINYRYSTDVFHYSKDNPKYYSDFTYKRNGDVLVLSQADRPVEIVYTSIRCDNEGIPMVWDNQVYIDALKSYIKEVMYTELFDEGKINQNVLLNAKQEYAFNARLLKSELSSVSVDEAESVGNFVNNLVKHGRDKTNGFFNFGDNNINPNF